MCTGLYVFNDKLMAVIKMSNYNLCPNAILETLTGDKLLSTSSVAVCEVSTNQAHISCTTGVLHNLTLHNLARKDKTQK